jgi:putative copper resistance protein D
VLPRFSSLAGWCFAAVALSGAVGAWVRLGTSPPAWHSTYGALVLAKTGALVVLGLCGVAHRTWSLPRVAAGERHAFARLAAVEALVMAATAALAVVLARTPPPPSSLTRATPPHAARFATLDGGIGPVSVRTLLLGTRPDVLVLTAAAVLLGGYLLAVARLRREGVTWPPGRTLLFAGGVLLACWCLCGGPGAYSGALLSVEVARLLTMGLVVPVLVTAGRPAALAGRGRSPAPGRRPDHGAGGRPLGRGNPADGLVALVGVLAVTLMTPLLEASLRSPALHLAVALAATAAGLLFVGPLLGLDRPLPDRRGSTDAGLLVCVLSLLLLVQAGHIHTSGRLLAVQWYGGLDLWWADPVADQGRAALVAAGFAVATLALVPLAAVVGRRSGSAAPAGPRPR